MSKYLGTPEKYHLDLSLLKILHCFPKAVIRTRLAQRSCIHQLTTMKSQPSNEIGSPFK